MHRARIRIVLACNLSLFQTRLETLKPPERDAHAARSTSAASLHMRSVGERLTRFAPTVARAETLARENARASTRASLHDSARERASSCKYFARKVFAPNPENRGQSRVVHVGRVADAGGFHEERSRDPRRRARRRARVGEQRERAQVYRELEDADWALHRAFSVFLFDKDDRLLLQQRAANKITFPSVWTNTCCSHQLTGQKPDEMDDEASVASGTCVGAKRAAVRKMKT